MQSGCTLYLSTILRLRSGSREKDAASIPFIIEASGLWENLRFSKGSGVGNFASFEGFLAYKTDEVTLAQSYKPRKSEYPQCNPE